MCYTRSIAEYTKREVGVMFGKKKEKVIDPVIHDEEGNFTLSSGVHILNRCFNVTLTGNAIVLESFSTTFKEISGKSKIQMVEDGTILELGGKAKIVLFKSGTISRVCNKAKITTINDCKIDYVCDKASIGTMNGGFIRFIDDKAELATMTDGKIMFVRDKAKLVTMIKGEITGIFNNANLVSMLDGHIEYLLNDTKIGTMNNGSIGLFADSSEISTLNKGSVNEMLGSAFISANMDGVINFKDDRTIILYSPSESEKRMREFKREKAELAMQAEANLQTQEVVEQVASVEEEVKPKRKPRTKQMKIDEISTENDTNTTEKTLDKDDKKD